MVFVRYLDFVFLRLLLLHDLVHYSNDPNRMYMTNPQPKTRATVGHGTVWGALMVQIIYYSQLRKNCYNEDRWLDTMVSDISADIVRTFLVSNADPTTRIVRTIIVIAKGVRWHKFLMETSPLALASFLASTADDSLERVRASLRLAQAVMKQQILFFQYNVERYDSNTTYYRLSHHQSGLIEKLLSLKWYFDSTEYILDETGVHILHDIVKNTFDEERLDEETVWKEIRAQGNAFSCDAEDIPG